MIRSPGRLRPGRTGTRLTSCFHPNFPRPARLRMPPTRSQLISFLAEIGVLRSGWAPEPGALPRLEARSGADRGRPSPTSSAGLAVEPTNGSNSSGDAVCCPGRLGSNLQPAPMSRAQVWRLLGIARPDFVSIAGLAETGRNLRHRPGGAPAGQLAIGDPGRQPHVNPRLNPAEARWAGSTMA